MKWEITIFKKINDTDSAGFHTEYKSPLATMRAYREDRHGNEQWKNRAAYTTATTLFRFRSVPYLKVTTDMCILCDGEDFEITSVEDVKGRGMYVEVLCERIDNFG